MLKRQSDLREIRNNKQLQITPLGSSCFQRELRHRMNLIQLGSPKRFYWQSFLPKVQTEENYDQRNEYKEN